MRGWHAHEFACGLPVGEGGQARLLRPLVRRQDALQEATWDEALDVTANRLKSIRDQHGAGAIGVLGSARSTNEDNFLLAKLARCALGTNNIDFSARLEALPGLFDLPQYRHLTSPAARLEDIEHADLILIWQTDPAQEHGAVATRVLGAADRKVPVIEVGVRSGHLGRLACLRLAPRPETDVHLAAGLLHVALAAQQTEEEELDSLAASVSDCTPEWTERATGVPAEAVGQAGQALAASSRPLVICSGSASSSPGGPELLMGLATLGRAAGGGDRWSHLLWLGRGSNLQGARDMGVVPYLLTGYQPLGDAAARGKFERAWGCALPTEPGLAAWDMLGQIRGLLVMEDDLLRVIPDVAGARAALERLDFLVVEDTFLTPMAEFADVVLPGASFADKDGTVTSGERRVQRTRRAVEPPGESRPAWQALCDLSSRLGYPMSYQSASEIMAEVAALTPLYANISYQRLEEQGGLMLPSLEVGPAEDAISPGADGAPETSPEFPLVLTADRIGEVWADDARVVHSVSLRRELVGKPRNQAPIVEISPQDAQQHDLRDGQRARVRSRRGEMVVEVRVDPAVRPGVVMLPFRMRELAAAVMPASRHAETGVPELRARAVSVEKV